MNKQPVDVSVSELTELLSSYLDSGPSINYAFKIVGHPGVGKSSIVRQIAEKKRFLFMDTRLAFKENIDLGGYPVPDHSKNRMIYFRPKFIPPEQVPEGYQGILWFLDEANRAHPTVIQTLFQIITERMCGEHALPKETAIVLAGNLGEEDHTMITDFDDSALDGRLAIFHLKPSAESWLSWASQSGIHPAIISYITLFPEKIWDEIHIHPNPRGWHQVSQALILSYGIRTVEQLANTLLENKHSSVEKLVMSLIGETVSSDFLSQVTAPREISSAQVLGGDPGALARVKTGDLPSEDLLWAVTGAIQNIRDQRIRCHEADTESLLFPLGNLLRFIGFSRTDTRFSFFYLLLKECGVFTLIPPALKTLESPEEIKELFNRFSDIVNPSEAHGSVE
ncbi:MAG: hypothetical protein KKD44_05100 [Proteobacteria bacterium]|nr:hypothetical protein [Pseudomonadota bacterium]